ncbi:DUF4129 domain-containing protein [Desulfurococcus amylolyticus]|uniref:Protein-glutamine gamma-glutamyltransferase-like C-terminal domain-containing protein n=1 Tax=Desulfurococcus amylolyticus DSM 16532 TaxID=768672 RepID=I3XRM2_DESAM|nr:DUF4129 domain-containing protein [Desulfurococcus amylolyticus]AFL66596.1 hypothetical protein Desfe_0697 [Desulfurococcus amylolyticus DSM 16532]
MKNLFIISIALVIITASTPLAPIAEDRHTAGFPNQLDSPISMDELIRELYNVSIITLGSSLDEASISSLLDNLTRSGLLNETYRNKLSRILFDPPESLIANISNPELRLLLSKLVSKENISYDELSTILKYVDTLKATNSLSLEDELIAYRILSELSSRNQLGDTEVPGRIMSTLINILGLSHISLEETMGNTSVSMPRVNLPGIALPGVKQGLPSLNLLVRGPLWPGLLGVFIAVFTIVLITATKGGKIIGVIGKIRSGITLGRTRKYSYGEPGDCISAYWFTVAMLASRYRVLKMPFETHREYLERIIYRVPPEIAGLVGEITRLYEVCRFGESTRKREADREAIEKYRELVNKIEHG